MDIINKYNVLKNEVSEFHDKLLEHLKDKPYALQHYKGIAILYSNLMYQPKVMLIGINPGGGNFKWFDKPVNNFDPLNKLEYLDYKDDEYYKMATQTIKLFDMAGANDILLKSTIKSNFYYIATNNANDLYLNLIGNCDKEIQDEFYANSKKWTKTLIDIVEPKLIICEGLGALKELSKSVIENPQVIKTDFFYLSSYNKTDILCYKRTRRSYIHNIERVAEKLTELLSKIN